MSLSGTTLTVSGVAAGDTTVTVSASDNSASASDTFAVTVETDTQPVLAAIADQSYTRGVEIEALPLPSSSTGNGPLTYSLSPALPAGLSFDATTRTLSGMPTGLQAATSYTYKVVDANADEATQSFNITVLAPLPAAPVNFQGDRGRRAGDADLGPRKRQHHQPLGVSAKAGHGGHLRRLDVHHQQRRGHHHSRAGKSDQRHRNIFSSLRAVNATGNGASSAGAKRDPGSGQQPTDGAEPARRPHAGCGHDAGRGRVWHV